MAYHDDGYTYDDWLSEHDEEEENPDTGEDELIEYLREQNRF